MTTEQESRQVAEESREKEWAGRAFLRELFLGNFSSTSIHPFPLDARGAAGVHQVLRRAARRSCATEVDSGRDRRDRRVPRAGRRRPAQARRLRHEDPEGVRRPRLHRVGVLQGHGDGRQLRRQHQRAALGAPVDRRAAAAQALRHARAEEEVPAALRRRRDLRVRAHRAARRLRSRRACRPPRSATATTSSSTARSSGARTARSPSCWS